MSLFDNLNSIYTFNVMLDEPGCKFWINEVSLRGLDVYNEFYLAS